MRYLHVQAEGVQQRARQLFGKDTVGAHHAWFNCTAVFECRRAAVAAGLLLPRWGPAEDVWWAQGGHMTSSAILGSYLAAIMEVGTAERCALAVVRHAARRHRCSRSRDLSER